MPFEPGAAPTEAVRTKSSTIGVVSCGVLSYPDLSVQKFEERPSSDWHREFRQYMPWIFAITCLSYVFLTIRSIPIAMSRHYGLSFYQRLLVMPAFSIAVAVICGLAWWTGWKKKRSAVDWAIAASLMYFLIFARRFILHLHTVWYMNVPDLVAGIIGLVVFLRPLKQQQTRTN
jgi:cytochrome bd-type quinol oxidase subunit 2